jgi:hypothetical protein
LNWGAPEPGVPSSVENGNNFSKLRNGKIRNFPAVKLLTLALLLLLLVSNRSD